MKKIHERDWKWFGNPGHLIVSRWCRFHLCTQIGAFLISTVGEYWPERSVREIHAQFTDPTWLARNHHLKGDAFDAAYMQRFGFEEIGCGRKYETMVFCAEGSCSAEGCGCGLPSINGSELDSDGYNDAGAATKGHHDMCRRWSAGVPEDKQETVTAV